MESHVGLTVHRAYFSRACVSASLSGTIIKKLKKKKLKIELPYDTKIAQLGIYPEDTKVV